MSMRNLLCAAILAISLSAPGYAADNDDAPAGPPEYGIEASTLGASLPSSPTGTVINSCATCRVPASYQLTANTAYFIGEQAVTFAQFTALARTGTHGLMIFVKADGPAVTNVVTRLVMRR
jgi:hypothetical protein